MLQELSGKAPDNSLAVSEVVARGAAIHAGIVAARSSRRRPMLGDEAVRRCSATWSRSTSTPTAWASRSSKDEERVNDILIPKNTQLPTAASRVYRTVVENQPRVRVKVLQGEAHAGRRVHHHRRMLDRGAAAEPAEGLAGPGALRRRQQRPDRRDGARHDQRQDGPDARSTAPAACPTRRSPARPPGCAD